MPENGGHLAHLHHKGGLAGGQVIGGADAGKDPVHDADGGAFCRDKGADLGHEDDQGRLAHVGRFTGHVGAGDDGHPVVAVVQISIIGDKEHVFQGLLYHRVAALDDLQGAGGVHLRAGVVVADGHLRQGAEHVQPGHGPGGGLDAVHLGGHAAAQLIKILKLQLVDPVPGGEEGVLQLLQFLGKVALVGNQSLLADIVLRHVFQAGGFGHVDIIAKNLVVAHLQLLDAGALPLPLLQLPHHLGAVVPDVAEAVHFLGIALAQDTALPDGEGRVVTDGPVDLKEHILQDVHAANLPQLHAVKAGE